MKTHKGYDVFEMSGSFLIPGFSIYLLEILKEKQHFFYIGMTGDPFYPSARAAFHRLSGHLEKVKNSTQNQLWIALKKEIGITDLKEFAKLKIKMHYFPIEGFITWKGENMKHEYIKANQHTEEYKEYIKLQSMVLQLEKSLIYEFSEHLLNHTKGIATKNDFGKNKSIFFDIKKIIGNEKELKEQCK